MTLRCREWPGEAKVWSVARSDQVLNTKHNRRKAEGGIRLSLPGNEAFFDYS